MGERTVRDCYSCKHSPVWRGVGTVAGCAALGGDKEDDIVTFCEASGCNDDDSPRHGWPYEGNTVECGAYEARKVSGG